MKFRKEPVEDYYQMCDDIGSGHFATVRKCQDRVTGQDYAAKYILKKRARASRRGARYEDIVREVSILQDMRHENVIKLYDVFESNTDVILILELVTGGELFDHISEKEKLSEEEAADFIRQILSALEHMHALGIAHLDLKPENVMLQGPTDHKVKVIDFGLSRRIATGNENIREMMGTPEFVAPEVINFEPLCLNSDLWSVGVITYILLSGCSPFLGDNRQETFSNICGVQYNLEDSFFDGTSDLAKDFIRSLLVCNVRKRASIAGALSHAWIAPRDRAAHDQVAACEINIEHFRGENARQRWAHSMRVVSLCNRMSQGLRSREASSASLTEMSRRGNASAASLNEMSRRGNASAASLNEMSRRGNASAASLTEMSRRGNVDEYANKGNNGNTCCNGNTGNNGNIGNNTSNAPAVPADDFVMAALFCATEEGNADDIARLLDLTSRGDLSRGNKHGETLQHVAAGAGHISVVRLLSERGAAVAALDERGDSALYWAARQGQREAVQMLREEAGLSLDAQNRVGETALHVAARYGHAGVVEYLCEREADLDLPDDAGEMALHIAVWHGFTRIVQMLCNAGCRLDIKNREQETPLHCAAARGHVDSVRTLVASKAQLDARDKDGCTALHLACRRHQVPVALLLLHSGCRLDLADSWGEGAVHIAAREGLLPVAQTLCAFGCCVDVNNKQGATPLHLAAKFGHTEVVRCLCLAGCAIDFRNKDGVSAEIMALAQGFTEIGDLLNKMTSDDVRDDYIQQLVPSTQPLSKIKLKVFGSSGVGKTTLIESLKTGWMGSLFRRRGSLMGSQRGQKGAPLNANNNANTEQMMARSCGGGGGGGGGSPKQKTVEDVSANGSYTRGVSIELASVPGVGELSVWEFSGVDTYHLLYDHFIGNVSCVHVVVYRLDDPDELQLRQLTYWLEFLRARLPHEHPIGHCGRRRRPARVAIVATHADVAAATHVGAAGEYVSERAEQIRRILADRYAADLAIADETYVVDAYVPSGAGVRALRSHLGDEKRLVAAALPPRTGFLDAVSARLPAWRRCARAFPALSWAQFKDTVRQQVNPLAGDEHLRELTQQLQLAGDALYLKGGSQSMQDVVVIAPRWLCGDVVGFLLAHDHIAATHGTGCYTVDNLQLLFPEADALDLLQVLEALQMCTQCDDDGEIVYEFPCLNFTETLPGLWEREGAYEGGSAVYGGYRLRPVGCDQLLNSVFARIQVQLRRSLLENHDPDNDLYQWHGGSKLCSGVLESLITLEGAGEVEVKARGPVDAQLSCFYFLDDVVSVVEAAIVEVCPGLALQRLVLSAADLAECQGASVDLAECQGAFVDLADCHGSVDLAECQDSRDLAECQRSVDLPESQDSGELARCQESDDPCLESVDLGDRESNEDQDCNDGDTGADVETYTAADVLRSQLRRGFVVANAAGSEEHLVDLLCFGAADALHALTLGVDLPAACLDPATRRRLASVLDPADPWGKDWCLLAVALGLNDLLPSIDAGVGEGESRTAAAITEWARREGATVGALVEKLQELGRADAAEAVLEAAPLYRVAAEDGGAAERQAAEARIRSLSSDLSRLSR